MKLYMIMLVCGLAQASFCQENVAMKLDELMSAYHKTNKFNGSVLIAQKGKILLQKGYGYSNVTTQKLNDKESRFLIYSITKTITSAVILKLVEKGKLSLKDPLSRFYPTFPKGDSITIEQLLSHTSGIYDYTHRNDLKDFSEKSFVEFLRHQPLDFTPGSSWSYSNSGYWLLGFIIEKITGMPYEKAVLEIVFKPLQMQNSGFDFKDLVNKNKTTGYELFNEVESKESEIYEAPGPYAAGAVYSTISDLYKYHQALQNFSLLQKSTLEKAYTPVKNDYGLGWMIRSFEGAPVYSHSGGAAGFRSNFLRLPSEDICIILLNNNEGANLEFVAKNILNVLFKKPYDIPSEIIVDKEILNRYTGYFRVKPGFTMYITISGKRLAAQATGQPNTILLAKKADYFFAEEANGFLEFVADSTGIFNEMIIHQGTNHIKASRIFPKWGLLGTATDKGWSDSIPDIEMTSDTVNKNIWRVSKIALRDGEFKFRFNNEWMFNFGDNENDRYLEQDGKNIIIGKGFYDLVLDLTNKEKPLYHVKKSGL